MYSDYKIAPLLVSKELSTIDKTDLLVSRDYNSLYPSAMAHPHTKCPKVETAKAISEMVSKWLCSSSITEHGRILILVNSSK